MGRDDKRECADFARGKPRNPLLPAAVSGRPPENYPAAMIEFVLDLPKRRRPCQEPRADLFFINMQARNDAEVARDKLAVGLGTIERIA